MNSQKNIQDELGSLDSGLPLNNNPAFSVPDGYFEGLAASVLAKIKSSDASGEAELRELSPLLARIPKVMPYSVPLFYFEQNLQIIPDFSQEPQLTLLNAGDRKVPYALPQGYFESFAADVLSKVAYQKPKVIPLFARKWVRMAAAAVVGGALFTAGYQYFHTSAQITTAQNKPDTTQSIVATIPAIKQEIKKASTEDLEKFIRNVPVAAKETIVETTKDKSSAKEFLKDVSDAEMEAFLSAVPATDDELFVTD